MPTASSHEASALGRDVGVLQKVRQYFLSSAGISCYVQTSPFFPLSKFWNIQQTETLEGQTHKYFS